MSFHKLSCVIKTDYTKPIYLPINILFNINKPFFFLQTFKFSIVLWWIKSMVIMTTIPYTDHLNGPTSKTTMTPFLYPLFNWATPSSNCVLFVISRRKYYRFFSIENDLFLGPRVTFNKNKYVR